MKQSMKAMKSANPGMMRAGKPDHADSPVSSYGTYAMSNKLHNQSAGAQRMGDNRYSGYPDVSTSDDSESTGHNGAGSKKGTRGSKMQPIDFSQ